jgi:hypothetical protein
LRDAMITMDLTITLGLFCIAAALAYMGHHVTFHPAESVGAKRRYKVAFIALTLSSVPFLVWQTMRAQQTQMQLETSLAELKQRAAESVNAVTGGDSFAYYHFDRLDPDKGPFDPRRAIAVLVHVGNYPLRDLVITIFDRNRPAGSEPRRWHDGDIVVGNVPPNSAKFFPLMTFEGLNRIDVDILFAAQNGQWAESVRFVRSPHGWTGMIVVRDSKENVIFQSYDPGFPVLEEMVSGVEPFEVGARQLSIWRGRGADGVLYGESADAPKGLAK